MRDSLPQIKTTVSVHQECKCGASFEADATGSAAIAVARVKHQEFIDAHRECQHPEKYADMSPRELNLIDDLMNLLHIDYDHAVMNLDALRAWVSWLVNNRDWADAALALGQLAGIMTSRPEELRSLLSMAVQPHRPYTTTGTSATGMSTSSHTHTTKPIVSRNTSSDTYTISFDQPGTGTFSTTFTTAEIEAMLTEQLDRQAMAMFKQHQKKRRESMK